LETKQKTILPELIWMRSIACLAVVLLHAVGEYLDYGQPGSAWLWTGLSALLLFATPTFAFMSAFLIGFSKRKQHLGQVLWTRVKYLLLPFVGFAFIYAAWGAYNWHLPFLERLSYNLRGGYHGYFILIVMQFYLAHAVLEPLLIKLRPRYALAAAATINLLYLLTLDFGLVPVPNPGFNLYLLFPAWALYYVMGFYMGRNRDEARAVLRRHIGWVGAFTALAAGNLLYAVLSGARPALSSQRFEVLLFSAGAICLFCFFSGKSVRVPATLSIVNKYSFGIYLWHWLLIELVWRLAHPCLVLIPTLGIATLWLVSLSGSIALTYLVGSLKAGQFLVGKPGLDYRSQVPAATDAASPSRIRTAGRKLPALLLFGAFLYGLTLKQLWLMQGIGIEPTRKLLLVTLAPTLALLSPALWLKGRRQLAALLGADALITLILYANIVYFRQFRDLVSVASLRYAGQLGTVKGSVFVLLHTADLRYGIDLLVLAALLLAPRLRLPRWSAPRLGWIALAGTLAGVALTANLIMTDPGRTEIWFGPTAIAQRLGLLNYQAEDLWRYGSQMAARLHPSPDAVATVREWFADSPATTGQASSKLYGSAAGANLINLQVESLHNFVIGLKVGGQEITPNLNRLEGEAVHFTDFYTQVGQGNTADAEFLTNCSLYPAPSGAVYVQYAGNNFSCLPGLLKTQGYQTAVMHADRPDFWNRATIYPRIGFDQFIHDTDYVQDGQINAWLNDASFLRQSADKLSALPQPFQAMVITVSSHSPYNGNGVPHTLDLGALEGTDTGNYLQTIHYVDAAIGSFISQLKTDGLLDHSILTVYGDHTVLRRDTPGLADLLHLSPGDELGWAKVENQVPFFIRLPDGQAAVRSDPAGEIDIAPTEAALLGISTDQSFFMGRDLFAGKSGTVVLHDGSTITPGRVFLAGANALTGACYSRDSGTELRRDDCTQQAQDAKAAQNVSAEVLNLNLQPEGM
jgi:phosphoglycerol transferase MdoB-like AlkP superfamily enzyme/membrane-bound acyltransferase YfiQ involved in biofilm formation